jgi:Ca-activated chloride channel family protein
MSAEPIAVLRSLSGEPVALQGVSLRGVAEGCLFDLTVEQRYANREARAIEAVYTFPLPLGAVLLGVELEIGERRLRGIVERKREAAERYEQAVDAGDTAVLLEQARDGLYTVSLGNLLSGETALIRYRYAELISFDQGRVRLAIPTSVAPRYGAALQALQAHQLPSSDLGVCYGCALRLELRGELARGRAHSPSHALVASATETGLVLVAQGDLTLDRDLVVLVEGLADATQAVLGRDGEDCVALASVTVPRGAAGAAQRKALKMVVDCSGSMAGTSISQARDALRQMLGTLTSSDYVSLTRFGSQPEQLTAGLQPASIDTLYRLQSIVSGLEATLGGTELGRALETAIAIPVPDGMPSDLLLITDGEIWEIDALIDRLRSANHRLFVIAVGASPVEELARRVAAITRGACEFVTPGEDMGRAVARLAACIRAPLLTLGSIDWPEQPRWSVGLGQVVYPGDTVHVLAGFAAQPAGAVRLSIAGAALPVSMSCALPAVANPDDALARLAAARRLGGLPSAAAAELAERHQLVTRYTSCVMVLERAAGEKAAGMPVLRAVPQMLSAGWGGTGVQFAGLRAGARPGAPHEVMRCVAVPRGASGAADQRPGPQDSFGDLLGVGAFLDRDATRYGTTEAKDAQPPPSSPTPPPADGVLAESVRMAIQELARRKLGMPATIDALCTLGVTEAVLERLRALVAAGHREADVVAAWLAEVVAQDVGHVDERLVRRLARAADQALRRLVGTALR